MKKIHLPTCIAFVLGSELIGSIGALFTNPAIPTWYRGLIKPVFTPPNWLFGPAWTILFALMGIAMYLIYLKRSKKHPIKTQILFFSAQFLYNILWSIVFFGLRSPIGGFMVIVILWILILFTIQKFMEIEKTAGLLLVPYILWVTFAACLNLSIAMLNF